jgi:hypothetical protein
MVVAWFYKTLDKLKKVNMIITKLRNLQIIKLITLHLNTVLELTHKITNKLI